MSTQSLAQDQLQSASLTPYQRIAKLIGQGQHDQAIKELSALDKKALLSNHALLNAYGVALRSTGKPEAAIQMYHLALKLDSKQGGTWSNLGNALKDSNYPMASMSAHRYALDLAEKPEGKLWHNYGIALAMAGDHAGAIEALQAAIEIDPNKQGLRWDLARSQLALKDYRNGFENYQYRWNMEEAPPRRVFGKEWDGQQLSDEVLFVYAEQGFGDYIQCARYLPLLLKRAPNLLVEVKSELRLLMEHSFPDIQFVDYVEHKQERTEGFIASLLDSPRFFKDEPIPGVNGYLTPAPSQHVYGERLQARLSDTKSLKVGIVWSGSLTFKRNNYRSAPLDWFFNHFVLPGVNLFSLQMGPRSEDLKKLPLAVISNELIPHIENFNDTALILQKLDLVIMTCSSTAHLCGALNVPCWVLLDSSPHWLWGPDSTTSDWYQSLTLFRQQSPGDWRSVFDRASAQLISLGMQKKYE
ncbi:tetratricopeptide repeat protein [Polynucleobacter sp. MWH-HuK1]|uniref:tetratricopeptide repeat protein n=1 Tax=Polynucleobacter sp. MWH-HuK1 TaxID=1743158 RepID=UPI001C0D3C1E|nr:tetratricopeptide repeat protein [Polynucleobacter sp. MWH-HuK1]MBU3564423.1 tetratricopeptide repeat protein [Polynucleobacter sp. MWH-HuK1]